MYAVHENATPEIIRHGLVGPENHGVKTEWLDLGTKVCTSMACHVIWYSHYLAA